MNGLRRLQLGADSNLGFFGGSNMPQEVGRILDFAVTAAMGVNVEFQKQEV